MEIDWSKAPEGFPPVGVECEAYWEEDLWFPVIVIGHDEGAAVFRWKGGPNKGLYGSFGTLTAFRPLKTPEQLAAEQREREIAATAKELHESRGELSPLEHSTIVATWLYDHGYRKHEQ